MLVTSTALPEKQEDTETSAIIWLLAFIFYRNFEDNLKSNRRLIDTVPKYIKDNFFFTLVFPEGREDWLKEIQHSIKNLFHTFGCCQFEEGCSTKTLCHTTGTSGQRQDHEVYIRKKTLILFLN